MSPMRDHPKLRYHKTSVVPFGMKRVVIAAETPTHLVMRILGSRKDPVKIPWDRVYGYARFWEQRTKHEEPV